MELREIVNQLVIFYQSAEKRDFQGLIAPEILQSQLNLNLPLEGVGDREIENFINDFLKYSVNTSHKKYANQLWSKVESMSIAGEVLSAVTNTSMYTFEVAPVATLLEHQMIKELSNLIWKSEGEGVMTSGGSASNLQALMLARNTKLAGAKKKGLLFQERTPVILAAINAHYSIKRAANLLGIGEDHLVEIQVNDRGQICIDDLKKKLQELEINNNYPFCLVSTAGTTVEGAFDSLGEIAIICREHDLWLHIDGAYGASVLLSEKHRHLLKGIEQADSVSWDFHKMLGLNLPCAFLLAKQKGVLRSTLSGGNDHYLFHDDKSLDLGPKSLQCGRRNDIVKLWLTWIECGKKGFEARIDRLFSTAQEFSQLIQANPKFELVRKTESINICFRFLTARRQEAEIRQALLERGVAMVNYSSDKNGTFFRLAITRPDLEHSDLTNLIFEIERIGDELHQ